MGGGGVLSRLTELLGSLCHHLAINLPQSITNVDDLGSVGSKLVAADDVLK
jgi:hypothetical protein